MKKIVLGVFLLLISSFGFAQRMDWFANGYYTDNGTFTYVDSTKLVYDSGDGMLSFTYELLGDVLTYDIHVNVSSLPSSGNYYFYSGAHEEDYMGQTFWVLDDPNYTTVGYQNFSGSYLLDYDIPRPFFIATGIESESDFWSGWVFGTYYP